MEKEEKVYHLDENCILRSITDGDTKELIISNSNGTLKEKREITFFKSEIISDTVNVKVYEKTEGKFKIFREGVFSSTLGNKRDLVNEDGISYESDLTGFKNISDLYFLYNIEIYKNYLNELKEIYEILNDEIELVEETTKAFIEKQYKKTEI